MVSLVSGQSLASISISVSRVFFSISFVVCSQFLPSLHCNIPVCTECFSCLSKVFLNLLC